MYHAGTGERIDLLANEIGSWRGRRALEIPVSGEYVFDVTAGGSWTIEITQPTPLYGPNAETPFEISGRGTDAIFFVQLEQGLRRISASHDGSSNFIIWVYNSDASSRNLLFNEIGPLNGSTGLQIGAGGVFAVFDIQADGNWTLQIE